MKYSPGSALVAWSACLLWVVGCVGIDSKQVGEEDEDPLSTEELSALFATAVDPRRHLVTTYDSAAGPVFEGVNRLHRDRRVAADPHDAGALVADADTPRGPSRHHDGRILVRCG